MIGRNVVAAGNGWRGLWSGGVLLAVLLGLLVGSPAAAADVQRLAVIAVTGSLPDGVGQEGLLADVSPQLHRMVERLDRAAAEASPCAPSRDPLRRVMLSRRCGDRLPLSRRSRIRDVL